MILNCSIYFRYVVEEPDYSNFQKYYVNEASSFNCETKYNDNKKDYKTEKGKTNFRFRMFRGFLYELSNCIKKFYIGDVNVRVHFRRLFNESYEGIVVSGNDNDIENAKALTVMPSHEGMIFASGLLSMPLLRSFNKKIHTPGKNDSIWVEHLTCTFKNISNSNTPVLSMGISLKQNLVKEYTPILILMAYTRIDNRIGEYISKYFEECHAFDNDYQFDNFINASFR